MEQQSCPTEGEDNQYSVAWKSLGNRALLNRVHLCLWSLLWRKGPSTAHRRQAHWLYPVSHRASGTKGRECAEARSAHGPALSTLPSKLQDHPDSGQQQDIWDISDGAPFMLLQKSQTLKHKTMFHCNELFAYNAVLGKKYTV